VTELSGSNRFVSQLKSCAEVLRPFVKGGVLADFANSYHLAN
jgi:hypothetical protein